MLFQIDKKNKVKMLDIIFNSVEGEPFKIEEFAIEEEMQKLEFYYIEQSKYKVPLINSRQFVLYTADKGFFRILIDKEYYEKFKILYQKKVNIVWIKFMISLFEQQLQFQKKYSLYIFNVFLISLFFVLISWRYDFLDKSYFFLVFILASIFFPILVTIYITKKQEKYFVSLKKDKLTDAIEQIKDIIGDNVYEEILEKQRNYQPESFLNSKENVIKDSK